MEIYVIRHTSPDIENGICYGQTDVPLKDTFENEKLRAVSNLSPLIEVVYSSPLSRCKKLAEAIGNRFKIPVIPSPHLMELDFGEWEMKRWNEIDNTQLQVWMTDYVNAKCPKGESYADMFIRVKSFLLTLAPLNHKHVGIVTHQGVIKCIHSYFSKSDLTKSMEIKVDFGDFVKYLTN